MPKYVKPALGSRAERAIDIFGNQLRVAVLSHLKEHPGSDVDSMADVLEVKPGTLRFQLRALEGYGLVRASLPPEARRGNRPLYWRNEEPLRELYDALGKAIGLF